MEETGILEKPNSVTPLLPAFEPGLYTKSARAQVLQIAKVTYKCAGPERTRDQVKMLDDLYKNAVVSITKKYVGKQDDQPAIMVAQDIFGAMKKLGWHSAKLVDATGEPLNDGNVPRTDFEKDAAREMNAGKPYFERIVGEGSERRLLAATVVPVVMQRCRRLPYPQEGGRGAGLHPV